MKFLSIFSGIEAASVAWAPISGWECAGVSEIEPFCCRLLQHHYPTVPNLGDVTKFKEWNVEPGSVDLVVGGSPCQSFSVAGLRKGMDDPRGNLTLVYLGVVARLRPRWVVWENVPGVLSIDGGRVFGSFLGSLGELGYGFAYRVLDAQYVRVDGHERAVPQRRRRVFVVGHLGDWRRAAAVLFERACMSGDSAPGREAGKGVAGDSADGAGISVQISACQPRIDDIAAPLQAGKGTDIRCQMQAVMVESVAGCLQDRDAKGSDSDTKPGPLVVCPPLTGNPYGDNESREGLLVTAVRTAQTSANGHGVADGVAHTMDGANGQAVCFKPSHFTRGKDGAPADIVPPLSADADKGDQDNVVCHSVCLGSDPLHADNVGMPVTGRNGDPGVVAFCKSTRPHGKDDAERYSEAAVAPTQSGFGTGGGAPDVAVCGGGMDLKDLKDGKDGKGAVAFQPRFYNRDGMGGKMGPVAPTLTSNAADSGDCAPCTVGVDDPPDTLWPMGRMVVRRLTPTECERLQGFPDGYTDIPSANGKPCPDSPRYRALGNSMAVNVMRWIGRRIEMVDGYAAPSISNQQS